MDFNSAFLNDLSPAWANLNTHADIFSDQYPDALAEDTSCSGFPRHDPAPFPLRDTLRTKRRNDAVDDPQPTKRRQLEGIYIALFNVLDIMVFLSSEPPVRGDFTVSCSKNSFIMLQFICSI